MIMFIMVVLLLGKKNILSSEVINNLYVKHKVHVKKKWPVQFLRARGNLFRLLILFNQQAKMMKW